MLRLGWSLRNVQSRFYSAQSVFEKAQLDMKRLKEEPDNEMKLKIYALFKQASDGDVSGSRPGMMDFVKRAKYDAWSQHKGISQDDAKQKYANLINQLLGEEASSQQADTGSAFEGLPKIGGLDYSVEGKVFKMTLNRPKKFNALTLEMYKGIQASLKFAQNNDKITIAALTGTGNYYCSGNDLSNFAAAATKGPAEVKVMAEEAKNIMKEYVQGYIDFDKPLVALINGPAIGISVTVLGLFDAVYASNKATFQTPFAQVGQSPEGVSAYTFPLLMGPLKAAEVLLFGRKLTATEAKECGLVNEVFNEADFVQQTTDLLAKYSLLPPQSMRESKRLLRKIHKDSLYKVNEVSLEYRFA
ncbi:unnamed protein product, partial [Mesorhabditis belari]|uniref:ACB domain-containing protein n=1 Tax=Mesorhabditis belari TaxID=2138241 RepID=A0AAF3FDG8_9BILA